MLERGRRPEASDRRAGGEKVCPKAASDEGLLQKPEANRAAFTPDGYSAQATSRSNARLPQIVTVRRMIIVRASTSTPNEVEGRRAVPVSPNAPASGSRSKRLARR